MRPGIVIAYRDLGVVARRRAFAQVVAWYGQLGWPIIIEPGPEGEPFSRAQAINWAVRRSETDVLLQVDPDSLVSLDAARLAVGMAQVSGLVVAFDSHWYLTDWATRGALLDLAERTFQPESWADPEYVDEHGTTGVGNVVAFSRLTWQAAGGFDERFGTWGGDDGAFERSTAIVCGAPTRRVPGPMVHLWHPRLPESRPGHPEYERQFELAARYRDARTVGDIRRIVMDR